jgi:hypothetical protein
VENAVRQVGQTMASLGYGDVRLRTGSDKFEYQFKQLIEAWKREDPPSRRKKPVPLAIVRRVRETAEDKDECDRAIGDMCLIGFFYLCRPGEHVRPQDDDTLSALFRLCDVEFLVNETLYTGPTIPLAALGSARGTTLRYTNQKNGIQGQGIAHGCTGDQVVCPTQSVERRVAHLRRHHAPPETPLYTFYKGSEQHPIHSYQLTAALRRSATALQAHLGIDPREISAGSLRPGGATAMLAAKIDLNITQLVGRWRSDEMLKYLHVQSINIMQDHARRIYEQGHFTYQPDQNVDDPATFLQDYSHP